MCLAINIEANMLTAVGCLAACLNKETIESAVKRWLCMFELYYLANVWVE